MNEIREIPEEVYVRITDFKGCYIKNLVILLIFKSDYKTILVVH